MGANDNSSVQITINVVDANSGAVVSKVVRSLNQLGNAGAGSGRKLKDGLGGAGEAGAAAGRKIADGMDHAGGHALNALDNVRLVRDDLGIRIPRAMEKVISQSKLAMGAIGAIGGGLIALGSIEVIARLGMQVYELYERWIDTGRAVKEYREKAAEAAQQKLFDDSSFNSTIGYLKQANTQIDLLQAKKTAREKSSLIDNIFLPHSTAQRFTTDDDKHLAQATEVHDRENLRSLQQEHELMLKNIEAHTGLAKASANSAAVGAVERAGEKQQHLENLRYAGDVERANAEIYKRAHDRDPKKFPGTYTPSKDAGRQEFDADENNSDLKQRANATDVQLQQQRDLMKLRQEADNVGLNGERLLMAHQVADIEELNAKYKFQTDRNTQYKLEEAEIARRYHNEEMQHLTDQEREVRKRVAAASERGKTGIAATDSRATAEKGDVDEDLARGKFYGNKEQQRDYASGLKGAIDQGAAAETAKSQQDFNDRLAQMDAARADRFESESAKITGAAKRSVTEISKAWTEEYGQLGALDQRRVSSYQALQNEIGKINADAARQRVDVTQRLERETEKMEREGHRAGGTNRQSEQTQAILDEYRDRYDAIEELRRNDAEHADLYRRQEIAAEQIKNGKLVDEQRAMRDKLSGELQGLFSNPLEALKRQGEAMASKYAATYLMKIAKPAPGTLGTGGKGTLFGGLFNGIPGMEQYGGGRVGAGANPPSHPDAGSGPLTVNPASSTLNATTATIHVSSATITGLSNAGGGGMRNALYRGASGSGGGSGSIFSSSPTGTGDSGGFGGNSGTFGSSTSGSSSVGFASSTSSSGGAGAGMPADVASVIGGGVHQLPGMMTSVDQLGRQLGAKGSITSKIPGAGSLSKLASNPQVAGAASGALGLFSAYEGGGGAGGALQGAMSGAQLGGMLGGPLGAGIGAAAGAIFGFIGFGARNKAARYDGMTVKPGIANELRAFEAGTTDYQTAYDDMDKMSRDAKMTLRGFGSGANGYYNDTIAPEFRAAQTRLTRENKAGRSDFGMSAAQFHQGGWIDNFGSLATSSSTGFVHASQGEMVLNEQAAMSHGDVAMMMNAGANRSDLASYYGAGAGTAQPVSSPADVNLHFHSPDAKGARDLMMSNKHHIRAALNSSYDENSGGYDFA